MSKSQLEARIYGLGELITQRKLFAVPSHQRSYAWEIEEVEQFLTDIDYAIQTDASDYFVGLVVLQGPKVRTWEILDGQQRLTTSSMVYAAIRNWLSERGMDQDANQIENEFVGVRQLGGEFTPRLRMNIENRQDFESYVVRKIPLPDAKLRLRELKKGSSNYRLIEAAICCRNWIGPDASIHSSNAAWPSPTLERISVIAIFTAASSRPSASSRSFNVSSALEWCARSAHKATGSRQAHTEFALRRRSCGVQGVCPF